MNQPVNNPAHSQPLWKSWKFWICLIAVLVLLTCVNLLFIQFLHVNYFLICWIWFMQEAWYIKTEIITTVLILAAFLGFWKDSRLYIILIFIGALMAALGTILFFHSSPKTPLDAMQAFGVPITAFIGGIFLKVRDDKKKKEEKEKEERIKNEKEEAAKEKLKSEKELERQKQDLLESKHVIHTYTESLIDLELKWMFRHRKKLLNAVRRRSLNAFMRVISEDKLGIVIALMEDMLINNRKPLVPLRGANLSETDFSKYTIGVFDNLNLSQTNLTKAVLKKQSFRNTDFSGANMEGANFENADLRRAIFFEARYDEKELGKARSLRGTILSDGYENKGERLDNPRHP